jgi:hypothetical protein
MHKINLLQLFTHHPSSVIIPVATIAAAFIAYFASSTSQKNNSRTILAKYRSKWQDDARKSISGYIYNASLIVLGVLDNKDYINTDGFNKRYSRMAKNQTFFMSMLDPSKDFYKCFDDAFLNLNEIFFAGKKSNAKEMGQLLDELHIAANILLEKAWNDIKKDSRLKTKVGIHLNQELKDVAEKFKIDVVQEKRFTAFSMKCFKRRHYKRVVNVDPLKAK